MTTKTYKVEKIADYFKVTIEVGCDGNLNVAGYYIKNGEIVGKVWENQPRYKISQKILNSLI